MKWTVLLLIVLAGCSSGPKNKTSVTNYPSQKLVVDSEVSEMSRQEIITAIQDCQAHDLRSVPVKAKKKVDGRITDAIIDIICAPQKVKN